MYVQQIKALVTLCRKGFSHHHLPSEQLPFFLLAQPAPQDPGGIARMELGPTAMTFVLELRCLEDGGPGPDTLSGEGWGVETMGPPARIL